MTTEQTYRPDPPVRSVDWPALLDVAQRIGVRVFRPSPLGDLEHVATAPKEAATDAA